MAKIILVHMSHRDFEEIRVGHSFLGNGARSSSQFFRRCIIERHTPLASFRALTIGSSGTMYCNDVNAVLDAARMQLGCAP